MPPSIQDVLALDPVRHGRPEVVAGADLLGRTVRWAHVSQLTDLTGLLRGGELVLTTADALRGGAVRPLGDVYKRRGRVNGPTSYGLQPPPGALADVATWVGSYGLAFCFCGFFFF
ncbi:hypothetical protein DVA86_34170, partial [Streptomyces armeniacus]